MATESSCPRISASFALVSDRGCHGSECAPSPLRMTMSAGCDIKAPESTSDVLRVISARATAQDCIPGIVCDGQRFAAMAWPRQRKELVISADELGAGGCPRLPEEGHAGLGRRAIALALVAGGMGGYGVQPVGPAASRSGLDVVH